MKLAAWSAAGLKHLLAAVNRGVRYNDVPIRGGNWNNAANAGVFALNLHNARSNANTNIGARPALRACQKSSSYREPGQNTLKGCTLLRRESKKLNWRHS